MEDSLFFIYKTSLIQKGKRLHFSIYSDELIKDDNIIAALEDAGYKHHNDQFEKIDLEENQADLTETYLKGCIEIKSQSLYVLLLKNADNSEDFTHSMRGFSKG